MAEQDELMLLERVFLRLGSADTDDQLESALGRFLAPVLLKLASPADGVRKKVMELLVHINKRVKSRCKVLLPVEDLMRQYLDPTVSPFVTNFTILYIKMGYPRLPNEQQIQLLPQLVLCLDGRPEPQQNSFLQLITAALPAVRPPTTDEEKKNVFWSQGSDAVITLLLDFWLDVLLLPYNYASFVEQLKTPRPASAQQPQPAAAPASTPRDTAAAGGNVAAAVPTAAAAGAESGPPPGMSESALKRVTGDNPPSPDELEKIKLAIVQLVGSGAIPPESVACHLVVACADTRHGVATVAETKLKQLVGPEVWNDITVVKRLYTLFMGNTSVKGQPAVKPELKRVPAGIALRLKITTYLLKSAQAANQSPHCIQIVFVCLYSTGTNVRLQQFAVNFVLHMCLQTSDANFAALGPVLMSAMNKVVGEMKDAANGKLRNLAYVAIGRIGKRLPHLFSTDISLVQSLFEAISQEDTDGQSAIQETLALLSGCFNDLDAARLTQMEALIIQNIEKPETVSRLMAVRYAIAVFPSDHVASRYALLLACGDQKEEIFTEASKALKTVASGDGEKPSSEGGVSDPKKPKTGVALMPAFCEMIVYIQDRAAERVRGPRRFVIGNTVLAFNPGTYIMTLTYLRMCLAYSAGVLPDMDSTLAMQLQAPAIGRYVRQLTAVTGSQTGPVAAYLDISRQLLTALNGAPAMYCLLEVVAVAYDIFASQFVKHLAWIKGYVSSSKEDMSQWAAELYAIVCVESTDSSLNLTSIIADLTSDLQNKLIDIQSGSLLCLGYIIGRILARESRNRSQVAGQEQPMDVDGQVVLEPSLDDAMKLAVTKIVLYLDTPALSATACIALAEIGRCGRLPLNDDAESSVRLKLAEQLVGKVKSTKETNRVREKAALCLGLMCVGDVGFPYRKKVIQGLLECAGPRQHELHCTVGDALVCAAQASKSPTSRDIWTVSEEDFKPPVAEASTDVMSLLSLLVDQYVASDNQHVRQASCVWLLAVVTKCADWTEVQTNIMRIQDAFISLLSENDELTQDIASRGLGVVYDKCGSQQKEKLVSALVETLMTGKRKRIEVSADSPLFPEGALGKTPEGQNLSTYKELCSIANDLNQPDLIYKFLHLANHQAAWNTKKGAAVGFSTIVKQAGDQLAPHLDKILPKLYRYQFDPSPRIQTAMSSIWNSLVTDNQKTVSKYMKQILDDLIKNLTNNQWRVRESSCNALNDLMRGRPLDDIVNDLPTVWETCFRVRDDIKESVRQAADTTLKTLSRTSIKMCDASAGKVGVVATGLVLSVLLKSGMSSPVEEVRAISLSTIMKISKNAGSLLKPHVSLLVVPLLESITTLEPQVLNYLSLHAAASQAAQDKLDAARMAAYKSSPMMEVVNLCVQHVDETVLPELVPRLIELARNGVGLGTKVGCASFLISLARQCPHDLAQYSAKILGALLNCLGDRNAAVRKCYASAIGHLVKITKDASVEKLIQRLQKWYMEKDDEAVRQSCGAVIYAINEHSPDVLKNHSALFLPLVFLAMHEVEDMDSKTGTAAKKTSPWLDVWNDVTPGTQIGVRLYLSEITELVQTALASSSWAMKAQAGLTMVTIATKLESGLTAPHVGKLLTALLSALPGRTWTGKESFLKALSAICASSRDELLVARDGQPSVDEIVVVALKECRKENIRYKMEALRCTGVILHLYDVDRLKDVGEILLPILDPDGASSTLEDADRDTRLEFEQCAYECLGKCWPRNPDTQLEMQQSFSEVLCRLLTTTTWKVQLSALTALHLFVDRLCCLENTSSIDTHQQFLSSFVERFFSAFAQTLVTVKYSNVRSEALAIVNVIVQRLSACDRLNIVNSSTWNQLLVAISNMADSESQPELLDRANELIPIVRSSLNAT